MLGYADEAEMKILVGSWSWFKYWIILILLWENIFW